jgi:methylase of polypeptide subunit release factors
MLSRFVNGHPRVCARSNRALVTSNRLCTDSYVRLLLRNSELDIEDAKHELRWIKSAVGAGTSKGSSGEAAQVEAMVRRRAAGEPLQYILGKYCVSGNGPPRVYNPRETHPAHIPDSMSRLTHQDQPTLVLLLSSAALRRSYRAQRLPTPSPC